MNTLSFFNPRFTSDLFDVIDRNFSDFSADSTVGKGKMPLVDVVEKKDSYALEMELPGCTEKDVEINLKDRVLSITSKTEENEKEEKKAENKETYLIRERRTAEFSRSFTLPEDIDAEKVAASFKNGLLTIDIPRKPETQVKRIAISA